ncbi:Bug family tripartite tricarboxylate transporter substrate binding protein, partial [Diaphorobacter nitroreducens]|uniref:Bug family tripartite tricarboxylate transporter substrate binding protein n=1 Tax=Diaphorobacter nitroreducens TaxID=164759 RepID=UPI00406A633D
PLGARAQTAPTGFATRPVRVVVPFAAGGATDVIARILGERMAQRFGQSVVVDNKPGAAGLIAGEMVAKAPPDGMTALLGTTSSMLTNKYLYKKTPYDPLTELTPLVRVCLAPIALVVTADTPAQNLQDFMAWIRSQKGKLTYGSYGIGSHGQLACTTLSEVAGADMTHVAYKGEAPMVQDLLGGQIKIGMGSLLSLKAHIDAGKLRAGRNRPASRAAAARGAHLHRGRLPTGCAVDCGLVGDCRPQSHAGRRGAAMGPGRQPRRGQPRGPGAHHRRRLRAGGRRHAREVRPPVGPGSPRLGPPAASCRRSTQLSSPAGA